MAQVFDFIGGPCAGKYAIDGEPPAVQTFARNPSEDEARPLDLAAYRLNRSSATPQYHFVGIGRPGKFRNGPIDGHEELFIGGLSTEVEVPVHGPTGNVVGAAQYVLVGMEQSGPAVYEFRDIVDRRTVDDKALELVYRFYEKPDYSLYTSKPPEADIHRQVTIHEGNRQASIDIEIVEIVKGVWKLGWETMGSCQERPEEWSHSGMAYIWFPLAAHGQAFAKLLEGAGIEYSLKEKSWSVTHRNEQGERTNQLKFAGLNVNFHRRDFEGIVAVLGKPEAAEGG